MSTGENEGVSSAATAAIIGAARLVPPDVHQPTAPSTGVVSKTGTPVFGSPSRATSGTARAPSQPTPKYGAKAAWAALACSYALHPPPPLLQANSEIKVPANDAWSSVPPTATTSGDAAGYSTS